MEPTKPKHRVFPIARFVDDLPASSIPQLSAGSPTGQAGAAKRLVFVGDVHGMRKPLERLLEKVQFERANGDHLVFVGDMINKGTDNPGVIDLAIRLGASAVRGNHDNAVLDAASRTRFKDGRWLSEPAAAQETPLEATSPALPVDSGAGTSENAPEPKPKPHSEVTVKTAATLSTTQLEWLASLPFILRINLPPHPGSSLASIIVVHAGLVPGVPLDEQDPYGVMHMRSLTAESGCFKAAEDSGGQGWAAAWERAQEELEESRRRTVIFGHDALRRLQVRRYSIGLDSGCVYGNQLSALVLRVTEGGFAHEIVHVEAADDERNSVAENKV